MTTPKWNITELTGYEPKTTFWEDFSIAEKFGLDAIKDTFNRAFKEWKNNPIYITELCMVVNHKCWSFYQGAKLFSNKEDKMILLGISKYYADRYYEILDWADKHLKGKDLKYFYQTID